MILLFLLATAALWLSFFVVILRGLDTFQLEVEHGFGARQSGAGLEMEMRNSTVVSILV